MREMLKLTRGQPFLIEPGLLTYFRTGPCLFELKSIDYENKEVILWNINNNLPDSNSFYGYLNENRIVPDGPYLIEEGYYFER